MHVADPAHPEAEGHAHKSPSQILHAPNFITFLATYIKELKNESGLVIQISQHTMSLLESFKYGLNELHKLNEDQLKQLKDCLLEHPGHFILRKLLSPAFNTAGVDYAGVGRSLISSLIDLISKKNLPSEMPFSNKQLDQLIQKIKLTPIPKHIVEETVYKDETVQESPDQPAQVVKTIVQEKNTNERAIVRLRIPKRKIEESFVEDGAESARKVERLVEIDYDDKVLVFPALVPQKDYSIYAFNQMAPRAHRREMFNSLKKFFADYFDGRDTAKDMETFQKKAEGLYEAVEKRFIDEIYDEERMPLLDFEINLNNDD